MIYYRLQFCSSLSNYWIDTSVVFTNWHVGIDSINRLNVTGKQERLYPIFDNELQHRDRVYKTIDELYKEIYNAADSTNDIKAVMQA